jgi:hypothetical protein
MARRTQYLSRARRISLLRLWHTEFCNMLYGGDMKRFAWRLPFNRL